MQLAAEKLVSGARRWIDRAPTKSLYETTRSTMYAERSRTKTLDAAKQQLALIANPVVESPEETRLRTDAVERVRAWIDARLARDPEAKVLWQAIVAGHEKRREQAAALGWTPEHVDAVYKRLVRLLGREARDGDRRTPRELESDLRAR